MIKEIRFETICSLLTEGSANPEAELTPTSNLFFEGHLDSYSIILLAQKLEEKLGIDFDFTDLKEFNFQTVSAILTLLERKYGFTKV